MTDPHRLEEARGDYLASAPTLDDAMKMVELMLTSGLDREHLAALAYPGLVSRYYGERICAALSDIAIALGALRDEIEAARRG